MVKAKEEDKMQINDGKKIIKNILTYILSQKYKQAEKELSAADEIFKKSKSPENISIILSLTALEKALSDKSKNSEVLAILKDSAQLAKYSKSNLAELIKEYALAEVYYKNNDSSVALCHYNNAKTLGIAVKDEFSIMGYIIARIKQIRADQTFLFPPTSDPLVSLVKIGRSITAQTDIDVLLKVIAEETKIALQADRCTVFLLDKEKDELWSKVALGMDSQEIRFPAGKGLAGYTVKSGESINITDAYNDSRFNPDVDKATGYRTKTILCMPIKNNNQEIIGAFQVLNKLNGVFTKNDEDLLVAIGGSASIALENAQLFEQQKELYREQKLLFDSFINTLASSIDARDKITAGHSSRVKLYSMLIVDELGLDTKKKEIIEKAATLHDIGKIGIRDSVLQKEGKLTDEEYKHIQEHVRITHNILENIGLNEDFKEINEIACSHHEKYDGSGYYRHLKGEEIPYGGRILAVSDVFDAITSKRHYRDKMPIVNVIDILLKGENTHFDKNLVEVFLSIPLNKIVKVFLTENHYKFKVKDDKILSKYNLKDIYNFLNKEKLSEKEEEIVSLFNYYYSGKQD
ncbi:MAG: HD domain-containing phosphohydrolase [Candidatus Gastranaerophilaceae bacterium]|nr:HD domain-containing phosphohydrolase [Candidatus Gastranaerophilaceae bacterium]